MTRKYEFRWQPPFNRRYEKHPRGRPNNLHPLTELVDGDELLVDGAYWDVAGQNIKDMNVIYLPDVEKDENARLIYDGQAYKWNGKFEVWVREE